MASRTKTKKKTSIAIDPKIWQEWVKFVVDKTGSSRKIGEELENAIKDYMQRYKRREQHK
ncbi:hypothetical protein J7L00_00665 [Candidatus Bathyarchaeota archaeon]|nr:hypothetical protein [Candidatus Bathyarchaeota archaeon]